MDKDIRSYFGMNFVPPKFILCWSYNPQCDGSWRWGHWKVIRFRWGQGGGAPQWNSDLIRRGRHGEGDLSAVWVHSENVAIGKPEGGPSPGTESAATLIWDFPASRVLRKKCLLFKPPSLWYLSGSPQLRQVLNCWALFRSVCIGPYHMATCTVIRKNKFMLLFEDACKLT